MVYKKHEKFDTRIKSTKTLIKELLKLRKTQKDILDEHYRMCLNEAVWKLTEANGKYNTQYQSENGHSTKRKNKRHDHVYQRRQMLKDLMDHAENVDQILKRAIGCTVTKDEHDKLNEFKDDDGWVRYDKADIHVIDIKTGKRFKFPI